MNKTLLGYLKKCLPTTKGKWVDKLRIALWAYQTTPRQPIRETPYALAFGAEARILIESGLDQLRSNNPTKLLQTLEELEEKKRNESPFEWLSTKVKPLDRYRGSSSLVRLTKVSSTFDKPSKKGNSNKTRKDLTLSPTTESKVHTEYSH